jgi:hypothetical protein
MRLAPVLFLATLIASPPAHAIEVGATVQIKGEVAGCTFYGDAREVLRLRTLGNYRGAQAYMDILAIDRDMAVVRAARPDAPPLYVDGKRRYCGNLGPGFSGEPEEYTVVRKSPAETAKRAGPLEPGHKEYDPFPMAWFCLVPTFQIDIRHHEPNEPLKPEPDPKTDCTWAFLSDSVPGAAR